MSADHFTSAERSVLRRLNAPARIQRFLDELPGNEEPGGCAYRSAGAYFATAHGPMAWKALFGVAQLETRDNWNAACRPKLRVSPR